ncbi:MAG: DUF72 domain-containing protein [Bdellovibrionota bacterium]
MNENLNAKNMNLLKLQRYQQHNDGRRIHLGLPTWESALLRGTLYDHRCPIEEFLFHYAGQFDAVELSSTFNDLPYESDMKKLREVVEGANEHFRFCPIIPRRVSHEFPLGDNYHDMREFLAAVGMLGPHLGPIVLRLPETFQPENWQAIVRFARRCPKDKRFVVHLTHMDWFRKPECLYPLAQALKETTMNILIEDEYNSELPLDKLVGGDHLMIRFKGRPSQNQDEQRLAMWVYRLGEYKGFGIMNSYFFLYEEEEMCLAIMRKLAGSIGGDVRMPEKFDENADQMGFQL